MIFTISGIGTNVLRGFFVGSLHPLPNHRKARLVLPFYCAKEYKVPQGR